MGMALVLLTRRHAYTPQKSVPCQYLMQLVAPYAALPSLLRATTSFDDPFDIRIHGPVRMCVVMLMSYYAACLSDHECTQTPPWRLQTTMP